MGLWQLSLRLFRAQVLHAAAGLRDHLPDHVDAALVRDLSSASRAGPEEVLQALQISSQASPVGAPRSIHAQGSSSVARTQGSSTAPEVRSTRSDSGDPRVGEEDHVSTLHQRDRTAAAGVIMRIIQLMSISSYGAGFLGENEGDEEAST